MSMARSMSFVGSSSRPKVKEREVSALTLGLPPTTVGMLPGLVVPAGAGV